jgi:hypothetical protein
MPVFPARVHVNRRYQVKPRFQGRQPSNDALAAYQPLKMVAVMRLGK